MNSTVTVFGRGLAAAVLAFLLVWGPARASEEVFAALAERGLEPWPEAFLTELPFAVGPDGTGVLEAEGYQLRLPRATEARLMLVAIPGRVVIVDVVGVLGMVALSPKALVGLGVEQGAVPQQMQIIALRPRGSGAAVATAPAIEERTTLRNPVEIAPAAESAPFQTKPVIAAVPLSPTPSGKLALHAGLFSSPANADRLAEKIEALGLPTIVDQTINLLGAPRWKVLTGPFADNAARQQAKVMGGALLGDAYPVVLE